MSDISRWDLRSGRVGDNNEVFFMDRSKDGPWVSYGDAVFALDAKDALLREAREVLWVFADYPVSSIGTDLDGYVIKVAVGGQQPAFGDFDRARAILLKLNEAAK